MRFFIFFFQAGAKVIGIEMCPEAVENARLNAENNGTLEFSLVLHKHI